MKNLNARRLGQGAVAWALVAGLMACDSSVIAPERVADAVELPDQGIALHVSSREAAAGEMVWVELALSGDQLAREGEFQVVRPNQGTGTGK